MTSAPLVKVDKMLSSTQYAIRGTHDVALPHDYCYHTCGMVINGVSWNYPWCDNEAIRWPLLVKYFARPLNLATMSDLRSGV